MEQENFEVIRARNLRLRDIFSIATHGNCKMIVFSMGKEIRFGHVLYLNSKTGKRSRGYYNKVYYSMGTKSQQFVKLFL